MTRILVTGASGFIGRALVTELANVGHSVRAAMRQPADVFPRSVEVIAVVPAAEKAAAKKGKARTARLAVKAEKSADAAKAAKAK